MGKENVGWNWRVNALFTVIGPDQDILEAGYGNSMFAMQLVAFVESHFGLEIEADDLEIDNFRSINRVAALVARKQAMVAA